MYDYLIIGQGLAGTILSYQLINKGYRVLVLNHHDSKSSSYIAAGIFSPITGQRVAKIPDADVVLPYAYSFYKQFEQELCVDFFHPMNYCKVAADQKLERYIKIRLADPSYADYITSTTYSCHGKQMLAVDIKQAGYLNIPVLLDQYRLYLQDNHAYYEECFDENYLQVTDDAVIYKHIQAKQILFCNGLQAGNNRFFKHLAFNPTKGQLMTIRMQSDLDYIISGHVFVLPIANGMFHVGATYEREFDDVLPTDEGLQWLIKEFALINDVPYEILEHKAGIRPTTLGHQPFVQWHDLYRNVAIFSGFGSKGVSMIPYLADEFIKKAPA